MLRADSADAFQFLPGQLLCVVHVGLVERVHPQPFTHLPRRIFPAEELGAQIERVGGHVGHDLDVGTRRADRVVHNGDHAASVLARALRHQLLDPMRQRRHRRGEFE